MQTAQGEYIATITVRFRNCAKQASRTGPEKNDGYADEADKAADDVELVGPEAIEIPGPYDGHLDENAIVNGVDFAKGGWLPNGNPAVKHKEHGPGNPNLDEAAGFKPLPHEVAALNSQRPARKRMAKGLDLFLNKKTRVFQTVFDAKNEGCLKNPRIRA